MLERGVLLKELSKQVIEMRESMKVMTSAHKRHAKKQAKEIALLKSGANVLSRAGTADHESRPTTSKRVTTPLINVDDGLRKEDEFKPITAVAGAGGSNVIVDPTKSRSRMLAASSSMPLLSDEYGNYHTTGADVKPNPGRLSPVFKLKGKHSEQTDFTLNDLDRTTRKVGIESAAAGMQDEQAEELRAVRSQIVGMLSERYPPEKRQEQLMAVEKARTRAEKDREIKLADKAVPRKIYL